MAQRCFNTKQYHCLKVWNDFNEKCYKKGDFYSFIKGCLVVMEGHCHGRKKLRFFNTCLFETVSDLRMWKHKTLVFLVLAEPFSVEKTFFGTTSGLNTTVQNIASLIIQNLVSLQCYNFSKQHTFISLFFPQNFPHKLFALVVTITHSLLFTSLKSTGLSR